MKELENRPKDEIVVTAEAKQQKEFKHQGSVIPHPGHTLFEYSIKENTIRKASFSESNIDFTAAEKGQIARKRKVMMKPDCVYVSALNHKNATRHLCKMSGLNINPIIK